MMLLTVCGDRLLLVAQVEYMKIDEDVHTWDESR